MSSIDWGAIILLVVTAVAGWLKLTSDIRALQTKSKTAIDDMRAKAEMDIATAQTRAQQLVQEFAVSERAERQLIATRLENEEQAHRKTREALDKLSSDYRTLSSDFTAYKTAANLRDTEHNEAFAALKAAKDALETRLLGEIASLKAQIVELTARLDTKTQENADLTNQLAALLHTNGTLQQEKLALQAQLAKMQEEIDGLRTELDEIKTAKTTALIISTSEMPAAKVTEGDASQ